MNLDDDLCLCFHVSRRKVEHFLRVERPRRASQLSECGGAGTGCGWCVPYLKRLFNEAQGDPSNGAGNILPAAEEYTAMRKRYLDKGQRR